MFLKKRPLLFIFFPVTIALISFVYLTHLDPDVLLFLYKAELILKGKRLFVDIIDVNSPLIYYLNIPPVILSDFINISLEQSLRIFIFLLIAGVAPFYYISIKSISDKNLIAIPLYLGLLTQIVFSGEDFAQRDFLITLFLWPYVLFQISNLLGSKNNYKKAKFISGLLAGTFIIIKPNYLLFPLGLNLYILYKKRRLHYLYNPENIGFLVGFGLIVLIVALMVPEYIKFLSLIVKIYPNLKSKFPILRQSDLLLLLFLFPFIFFKQSQKRVNSLKEVLMLTVFFGLACGVTQRKGFSYHYFLTKSALTTFFFLSAAQLLKGNTKRNYNRILTLNYVIISASVVLSFNFIEPIMLTFYTGRSVNKPAYIELVSYTKPYIQDKSYASLSTTLYPLSLLGHFTNSEWALRYLNLWPLPGFYANHYNSENLPNETFPYNTPDKMSREEEIFFKTVIEDLLNKKPALLFVFSEKYKPGFGYTSFDYIEYFSQSSDFSDFLKMYKFSGKIFEFDVYQRVEALNNQTL